MEMPKRYDPQEAEPRIVRLWEETGIHHFDPTSAAPCFSVDTPPPYVSADHLHIGHAMSYSQAEFIVRYRRMRGDNVFYPMGFDDNGLPTERFVEKKHGVLARRMDRKRFIKLCLEETRAGAQTYRRLWERLGISVDWSLTYSTIDERSRRTAQRSFLELAARGIAERRDEPIQWCFRCGTSLAQADTDTVEQASELCDIAFDGPSGERLIISTTRPELLPACVALYAHPDDSRYQALIGSQARVPLFGHPVPIKTHADVDPTYGTGLMMVCTWGDSEDVAKWRTDQLGTRIIFAGNGTLGELAGPFAGLAVLDARQRIAAALAEQGLLLKRTPLSHQVAVHERCDTPVEFMRAPQWFIRVLDRKDELRQLGEQLEWRPAFMQQRYRDWVDGLKWDWCISRQRSYGVPLPVWYCRACGKPWLPDIEALPVDPAQERSPTSARCNCGAAEFDGDTDVMDTWMTSSLTPLINSHWAMGDTAWHNRVYPASLRVQGFEIIRTWLFYTMVKGLLHTGGLPWRSALISGWGLDEHGRKMSKRLGNFRDPMQIIAKHSADGVRYWSATAGPGHDLRYSEERIADGCRLATKLWNAARLVASACESVATVTVPPRPSLADRWIVHRYNCTVTQATKNFDAYDYSHALEVTERFFYADLCDNYLEMAKPRLRASEGSAGIAALLSELLLGTLKLLAPLLPFVTEEIYQVLFRQAERRVSIHVSTWPVAAEAAFSQDDERRSAMLLSLLATVRKWKSDQQLHANHPLAVLAVACAESAREDVEEILPDLAAGCRAESASIVSEGGVATAEEGVRLCIEAAEKKRPA
jgi:valyl-tRNA synthetase